MINKIFIFIFLSIFIFSKIVLADFRILLEVGNEIITNYQVKKESNYLEILNPNLMKLSKDRKLDLAKISLIKETIKQQEVKKFIKTNKNDELIQEYIKNLYLRLELSNKKELENK